MSKIKKAQPIQVNFNLKIRTDGEFAIVTLTQLDNEIALTREQAESLVRTLEEKLMQGRGRG